MCGAAYLSASAALRTGAGMVKIQTVEENRIPLQILLPEAMVCSRFDEESNEQLLSWCDVIQGLEHRWQAVREHSGFLRQLPERRNR